MTNFLTNINKTKERRFNVSEPEIQRLLDELPFPAVGFTAEGKVVQNKLAIQNKVLTWLQKGPPKPIQDFLEDDEIPKVNRVRCKVDGKPVIASGRKLSAGLSKIIRLMPQL